MVLTIRLDGLFRTYRASGIVIALGLAEKALTEVLSKNTTRRAIFACCILNKRKRTELQRRLIRL